MAALKSNQGLGELACRTEPMSDVASLASLVRGSLAACVIGTLWLAVASSLSAQSPDMWGRSAARNNVVGGSLSLSEWKAPEFDAAKRLWKPNTSQGVRWAAQVGNPTYGSPVLAGGRVLIGSNNSAAHLPRHPAESDLGCLLCFRESDGKFLWQYSSPKHQGGRANDWPNQGLCSTPLVVGDRAWLVDNRGCVVCLDLQAFEDDEDDGTEQGVFETLVTTNELVECAFSQGLAAVRDTFKKAGVPLGLSIVRALPKEGEWSVTPYGDRPRTTYISRIRREGNELVGYAPAEGDTGRPEQEVFRIENRLFPGIEADKFGPELRALLKRHGIDIPDSAIRIETAGKAWSFAMGEGAQRQEYRLKRESNQLTLTMSARRGGPHDADVVWRLDMPKALGVFPHAMSNCSPVVWGDVLFVGTSNGVDESHIKVPAPDAPSFLALDKQTGEVLWADASPGDRILHGQWSSPAVGVLGGVPQVIFAGGDGWVYSFRADDWDRKTRRPIPLWRFDCNPKDARFLIGGRGTKGHVVSTPVICDGRVYVATGDDPEHGEGEGHLWCLDPTRRGDVSPELAQKVVDGRPVLLPPRRLTAVVAQDGEVAVANPNSAVIWHYARQDRNGDGKFEFAETMHRTVATPVVANGLLVIPDFSGLLHCLDAKTGKCHWTSDLLADTVSSPLVVGDCVVVCDSDGDVAIYALTATTTQRYEPATTKKPAAFTHHEPLVELHMVSSIRSTPVFANNVLYLADAVGLYAIAPSVVDEESRR